MNETALPPAGAARDDILKQRTDNLEQQAEQQYVDVGAIPHDHDALNPDRNREIQHHIHEGDLEIGANHPTLVAKWVNYANLQGTKVWQEKKKGWRVATIEDFPDAKDFLKEDNTIRIADVILMCIRKDEHFKLEQKERNKRLKQQYGVEAEIHDLVRRAPRAFAGAITPELGEAGNPSDATRKKAAQVEATRQLGNRLRQEIPGVPIR